MVNQLFEMRWVESAAVRHPMTGESVVPRRLEYRHRAGRTNRYGFVYGGGEWSDWLPVPTVRDVAPTEQSDD